MTTTSTGFPSTGRIHELDALRGIAALGVVFWHYGAHFDAHPFRSILQPFYNAGFLLVDFFFVLSGYVIARAYWNERRQWHPLRNIWARVSRLYPLHFLMLLATTTLVATFPPGATDVDFNQPTNDAKHFILNLLLLNQAGWQDGWSFNTPAWSISTEFIVNVAFLAFIATPTRLRWMLTALLAAVGYVMYCLFQPPVISGQTAFGFLDANLLRCALGFSAGIGVYWAVHRLGMGYRLAGTTRLCDAIGFASIFGMVVLMLASSRHPPIRDYLLSIAVAMSCVTFVPFSRFVKASLSPKKLVFLGDISYSIYLVHYPLQLVIYSIAEREAIHMPYASPAFLAAYTGFVIAVAAMTHRCVELPWQARFLSLTKRKENQPA